MLATIHRHPPTLFTSLKDNININIFHTFLHIKSKLDMTASSVLASYCY